MEYWGGGGGGGYTSTNADWKGITSTDLDGQ